MRLLEQHLQPPSPDELGLFNAVDQARYLRVMEAPLWKALAAWLASERERLFEEECRSNQELWENRGALLAITRLLRSGPYLVVQYSRQQETATP